METKNEIKKIEVVKCPRCNERLKFDTIKFEGKVYLSCANCGEDVQGLINDYGLMEEWGIKNDN